MKFTEEKLERAFAELLGQEGFPHHLGISIVRKPDEVLIEEDLMNFLLTQYASKGITINETKSIILQLKSLSATDLYESNKTFLKMLSDGFILKREDRNQKDIYIQLINYTGLNNHRQPEADQLISVAAEPEEVYPADNNIYKFVNQLEIVGSEKRIPDGIVYINGLPLVVFEFKSAIREEATIYDAFKQLTIRYRRDIPELFKYNAFCVISDGVNNKSGSYFAPYEFFYGWRRVAGLAKDVDGIDSMFTLIQGMFHKNRLRDIIRNFIYIPDSSKKNEKIVCRYPQYYAARALYDNIKKAQKPEGNGKGGTYFGATGCGKSFTMLYLTRLLMKSEYFESPTIVLITDRTNVICISDEAHRSQVNLDQKVKVTEKGVTKTYGFAKYLHDSLPNATFVGFTGTPIDATLDVFGKVVDAYTMTESVRDEITVRIVYEGRAAKVLLNNSKLKEIEDYYSKCAEFAQQTKDFETRFMGLVKRLKAAYDICAGSEQLTQLERDYTHFYLAVRSIVFKLTKGNAPDTAQMNAKVREMIKEALQSDGVEEIFKLGDEAETEQDIFDEDYLAKIDKIKLPNTKIKLLQQLLAKVIAEIKKVNRVKGIDFTKKMQALVDRYNERDEKDILTGQVLDDFAEEITKLIWEVHKEFSAGDELGIDFQEKAFYDILKELCVKYDFKYPDDKMIELAKAVKDLVDGQAKFPDWNKRDDIKSALKVGLILLLDEFGYPPVERDEVYVEIFEQAENFKKNNKTG